MPGVRPVPRVNCWAVWCAPAFFRLFGILKSAREKKFFIDGRRLAGASARVPSRALVLPTAAVHALGHPDFTARDATILQPDDAEDLHVQFRSGPHTFIARTIEGHYPGYRHVIPSYLPDSVTIPETHRSALIAWLRSLNGKSNFVCLTWEKPAHLTLTHRNYDTVGATI